MPFFYKLMIKNFNFYINNFNIAIDILNFLCYNTYVRQERNGTISRRTTMANLILTIASVIDSKSASPERKNTLNIMLWESLVNQMLNLPRAA